MVNSILQYIEPQLKAYMQFLNRVDSPVFRISNGEMIKGNGQEKEVVTISDLNGNSLYIRQTQPETINERKALSSCDKEYNISARCKLVFYTFGCNDFTINPDKVKSKIINTLARLDFSHYSGSSTEIKIDINGNSLDMEKIYTEETGKEFSGNVWPTLVSVDFTLSYVDTNCNTCDIDDSETVVTWTPDLTPENCETKAICEVISKCDVITLLQEQTASLQEQIDNLPPSGGLTCEDLLNCIEIQTINQTISDIVTVLNGLPTSFFSCADLQGCEEIQNIIQSISDLNTNLQDNVDILSQQLQSYIESNDQAITEINNQIITINQNAQDLDSAIQNIFSDLSNHTADTNNPHNVTLEQARSENSSISGDINANNNTIINLKDAVNPQEPITKIQFDTYVSAVGGNRGAIDCSTNPNYPASNQGDRWEVTVAGKIGGPSGINVDVYDEIVCVAASASGDQATVGVNFYIVQGNIERATETTNGYTSYATDAEVQAGIENTKSITSLKLANWWTNIKTLAQTFSAKITFSTAPRFNSASTSQYLKTDASKDLTSVSTIPATDITEDSTHRFATDSEKTTWNAKQNALGYTPEDIANKVSTVVGNETDVNKYPNTKGVYDYVSLFLSGGTTDLGVVISQTNTPPGSPITGDRYLVGDTPTGAWVGSANKIATWSGASWSYTTPSTNGTVFITATLTTLRYNGSAWVAFQGTAILQNGNSLGVAMGIGTNDNFDVNFKRNGVTQWSINSTGALVRSISGRSINIGDSFINLTDSSTAATVGIQCNQTLTNNRFSQFLRWGQTGGGNFTGTAIGSGDYLQISNGGTGSNPYPIMIRGSVIHNFIGHTGTNIATRLDNVGLRIGTMADIHTANTNLFDLKGKFHHDVNHNVVVGSAALATTVTDGFFYIPTCAGAPTGVPTTKTGRIPMVYDSTNNKFYMYNGGWKSVTLT